MQKLPKHVRITKLTARRYVMEYTVFGFEPTIPQLMEAIEVIRAKIAKSLPMASVIGEARVYVRCEDVAVGIRFVTDMTTAELEKHFGTDIFERD